MEDILKTNENSLPLGINCMELCVKEVHNVTQGFLHRNREVIDLSGVPSWKFPHLNMEKLDVFSIMDIYRTKNLGEAQQYQELLELLVDRVYFSLLITDQFLTKMDNQIQGNQGQGDGRIIAVLPWENKKALSEQINSEPFHLNNIGILLKQIHSKVSLKFSNQTFKKKIKKPEAPIKPIKFRNSPTQTDLSPDLTECETCFLSQNILKILADTIAGCLSVVDTQEKSSITKFRNELKKTVWDLTQRAVVLKWCQAVESDSQKMLKKVETLLKNNSALAGKCESLKQTSLIDSQRFALALEEIQSMLKIADETIQKEKFEQAKLIKENESIIAKAKDLEEQLQKKVDECIKYELDLEEMKSSMQTVENSKNELHAIYNKTIEEVQELTLKLETKEEEKNSLSRRVGGLEAQLEIKEQEISHLSEKIEKCKIEEQERPLVRKLMEKAKLQIEGYKKAEKIQEESRLKTEAEIKRLKDYLEEQEAKIELLTLYPDLNGPINPPKDDTSNPIAAMEMQVKSNQLRIDILKGQTERMSITLSKIRHLQSR